MSSTGALREELKKKYPGKKWADKVDKMSDSQVIAISFRANSKK